VVSEPMVKTAQTSAV